MGRCIVVVFYLQKNRMARRHAPFDKKKRGAMYCSPRFLCRPTALYIFARAVGHQRAIHTENSGFASPTLGRHISTFRGYRILFPIRNPYINRFTNHFSIHS